MYYPFLDHLISELDLCIIEPSPLFTLTNVFPKRFLRFCVKKTKTKTKNTKKLRGTYYCIPLEVALTGQASLYVGYENEPMNHAPFKYAPNPGNQLQRDFPIRSK